MADEMEKAVRGRHLRAVVTKGTSLSNLRKNLGLGSELSALPITNGGTGAADAETARANLGIVEMPMDELEAMIEAANGAAAANVAYRGNDITPLFESGQLYSLVQNGDFSEVRVGDYFDVDVGDVLAATEPVARVVSASGIDGPEYEGAPQSVAESNVVRFRVAHVNYHFDQISELGNHVVVVPDSVIGSAVMNADGEATSGYSNSDMNSNVLPKISDELRFIFGDHMLSVAERESVGYPAKMSSEVETVSLLDEREVFGRVVAGSGVDSSTGPQLALFRLRPNYISADSPYWERSLGSAVAFCSVGESGKAGVAAPDEVLGIRPKIVID